MPWTLWTSKASLCAASAVLGFAASEAWRHTRLRQQVQDGAGRASPSARTGESLPGESSSGEPPAVVPPQSAQREEDPKPVERTFGLCTLLEALQVSERVTTESIEGPFQLNPGEEAPLVCFQFKMSHFVCKAYLAAGADEGTRHLKLQTIFEDNRNGLIEEHRYFMANEWNNSKPYTRLKCGSSDRGRTNVFTLEYDLLCPVQLPHAAGVHMLTLILRMWYTSMVACVMHIVAPRELPFATHAMIVENTLTVAVQEEDSNLQQEACPICLENFQVGDKVRRLPCMHLFHVVGGESSSQSRHCNIDRHLVLDKQCPICKTPIDIMERMERDQAAAMDRSDEVAPAPVGEITIQPADSGEGLVADTAEEARPATSEQAQEEDRPVEQPNPQRLPEQAAELERVVRSLQSRWLQIQDVVAGVQQMLHYLEDSHSTLSAVRNSTARVDDAARTSAETGTEEQPQTQAAPETVSVIASPTDVSVEPPVEPQLQQAAPAPVVEIPASPEPPAVQAPVEAGWEPFTQAEKVCNAYTWRRRRLGMLQSATSSTEGPCGRSSA